MRKVLLTIFISLMALSLWADEVRLDSRTDKAQLQLGEQLIFTIVLDAPTSMNLELPDVGDRIQGFRVINFGVNPEEKDGERTIQSRFYKLEPDVSGTYLLPEVHLSYLDKKGERIVIKSSEIFIEVKGDDLLAKKDGEGSDIRDIKGIYEFSNRLLLWLIGGAVVLLLGLAFLWWRTSRTGKEKFVPLPPPCIEALNSLKKLEISSDKSFYFKLTDILRRYFERSWHYNLTDLTFEEIKSRLRGFNRVSDPLQKSFLDILEKSELVKFANVVAGEELSLDLHNQAKRFVDDTKPEDNKEVEDVI